MFNSLAVKHLACDAYSEDFDGIMDTSVSSGDLILSMFAQSVLSSLNLIFSFGTLIHLEILFQLLRSQHVHHSYTLFLLQQNKE